MLVAAIDQVIAFFNARKLDLPDGFFDRRTQFLINGVPFETLLGQSPNDPLVLMLARGPAGFRFTHEGAAARHPRRKGRAPFDSRSDAPDRFAQTGGPSTMALDLLLSGSPAGTGEAVNAVVSITLRLAAAGHVEIAEASLDEPILEKIREARLRP